MVRGYHIYKKIWEVVDREICQCKRERSNQHNPFAVAIIYTLLLRSRDYSWVGIKVKFRNKTTTHKYSELTLTKIYTLMVGTKETAYRTKNDIVIEYN